MVDSIDYLIQLLPELILTVGACAAMFFGLTRGTPGRSLSGGVSLAALLLGLVATVLIRQAGAEVSPPGLHITPLVFYVRFIALGVGTLILLVNWHIPVEREQGEYFAMVLLSIVGVLFTASANNLIVLFFAIELGSIPTYILIGLSREDRRASEASVKYFFLGAMAAAIMVYGFSFLYGASGTMALQIGQAGTLAGQFAQNPTPSFALIGLALALAGILFKIAAVPFHVYAPDVYEGAASPITGLLGFLPKLAGFVALVKILASCGWPTQYAHHAWLSWLLWAVAAVTMTVGNVLALRQTNVKRTLAYSSIAHTGYMLIAVLVGPVAGEGPMRDGVAAMLFYIGVYGMMNLGAFAVLAALQVRGEAAESFDDLAGVSSRYPGLALIMAICVFSLMGFPPTAGMLGKVYIFSSAFSLSDAHPFREPMIWLAVIGVVNSAIAAAYYLRIAGACYLRDAVHDCRPCGGSMVRIGAALCSVAVLVLFVWPKLAVEKAQSAADGLSMPVLVATPGELADASAPLPDSVPHGD